MQEMQGVPRQPVIPAIDTQPYFAIVHSALHMANRDPHDDSKRAVWMRRHVINGGKLPRGGLAGSPVVPSYLGKVFNLHVPTCIFLVSQKFVWTSLSIHLQQHLPEH